MKHLDLFSGIGGFALAAEMVWQDVEHIFVEYDPFCQTILTKHWPQSYVFGDVDAFHISEYERIMQLWKEGKTESALSAELDLKQKGVLIASPAIQDASRNGGNQTTNITEQHRQRGLERRKKKSSPTMGVNVPVAANQIERSLPSTINTEEEISNGETINRRRGNLSSRTDTPTITKSSATTATTQNITTEYAHTKIDLLTGGFPCQPFSQAGRRKGTSDDRYKWPSMLRIIRETKPTWVIAENVGGLVTWNNGMVLERVCLDLESEGYEVQPFIIPAVAVNAPHRRDRIWIVAHANRDGRNATENGESGATGSDGNKEGSDEDEQPTRPNVSRRTTTNTNKNSKSRQPHHESWKTHWAEVATALCRVDDGLPRRLDRTPRLKALGNAIVPQVAAEIMSAIITL